MIFDEEKGKWEDINQDKKKVEKKENTSQGKLDRDKRRKSQNKKTQPRIKMSMLEDEKQNEYATN